LPQAEKYEALQCSFDWDQKGYSLVDWSPGGNLTADDIRMPEHPGDAASLTAYTTNGWSTGRMTLLSLWVRSNSAQPYPFRLFLKPLPTTPVAYEMESEEELAVQLAENNTATELLLNRPNPFRDMTTIIMQSSRAEQATLRIFDLNGKLIHSRTVMLEVGENEFIVSKTDLNTTGIYWYEIESEFQYRTNRMIIVD
jgi:hypothetical protein